MNAYSPRNTKRGPEAIIQKAIIKMLRGYNWHVMETHGNMFQKGFPDLFACTTLDGGTLRWIEVKNPLSYKFTPAQIENFPKMCANGCGVWIMVAATDAEYKKLFRPHNWYQYLSVMR